MTSTRERINNSKKISFGLFGASGFGREIMPVLHEYLGLMTQSNPELKKQIYFLDDNLNENKVNGYPLISRKEFFELDCCEHLFNIAIADSKLREKIANELIAKGANPIAISSHNSTVYDNNEIGEGSILCANTIITSNAKIGKFFHANIFSYVAHDCVIGDYVTFAPNVHCNGNVHIHNHAYIGTGAIIKQGKPSNPLVIGEGAVVGMGAVVTKNVPAGATVIGNPAKPLSRSALRR